MKKIWRKTTEDVENTKKYVETLKEYHLLQGLWDVEKFQDLPLYIGFGAWKFRAFFPYIGSKIWKYSELSPYTGSGLLCSLWDLEKASCESARHETWSSFFGLANKYILRTLMRKALKEDG